MAYFKPSSPIKFGEDHIYPLTIYDQIIMADGSRWNGKAATDSEELKNLIAQETDELENLITQETNELRTSLNQKATTANYSATFTTNGWSLSAPYQQTVAVNGILVTDTPIVDVDMSSASTGDAGTALTEAWNCIGRVTANAGSVTAYCYEEKPTVNVPIVLKVVR